MGDLIQASLDGDLATVQRLVAERADVNAKSPDGSTALMEAALEGHAEIVRALLEAGADVNAKNNRGWTALLRAAQEGDADVVRLLLDARADTNVATSDGSTALMRAAYENHIEVVRLLLAAGANVNAQDNEGWTPLMFATGQGHTDIVRALLEAGADVNVQDEEDWTALIVAAENNHADIVRLLASAGADLNIKTMPSGPMLPSTALMLAAHNGHVEAARALLEVGADMNLEDSDGWTALMIAADQGHTELVKALLAAGADPNIQNIEDKTALDLAAAQGFQDIVDLLQPKWNGWTRADVDAFNPLLETPLGGSFCPFCVQFVPRAEGTPFLKHVCRQPHPELYALYKNAEGLVEWCNTCGRPCSVGRHYALQPYQATRRAALLPAGPAGEGDEAVCRAGGGGGIDEKIKRADRMIGQAAVLQRQVGTISAKEARKQLIEEAWNAPLARNRRVEEILRDKKWTTKETFGGAMRGKTYRSKIPRGHRRTYRRP